MTQAPDPFVELPPPLPDAQIPGGQIGKPVGPPSWDNRSHVPPAGQGTAALPDTGLAEASEPVADPTETPHPNPPIGEPAFQRLATRTIFTDFGIALGAGVLFGFREVRRIWSEGTGFAWPELGFMALLVVAGLAINIGVTSLRWFSTRFVLTTDEFRVDSGFFMKTSKRIALSRIQSVDTSQPLIARLLGVVKLHINAGPEDTTELAYLTQRQASELHRVLLRRNVDDDRPSTGTGTELYRIPLRTIIQGVALSNTVWFWLIALPLIWLSTWLLPHWHLWNMVFKGGILAVLGAIVIFLWRAITPNANFTLTRSEQGLTTARGLFNRVTATVPLVRVQALVISQPLWWRALGRYRVSLDLMSSLLSDDDVDASELLPIGSWTDAQNAYLALWPHLDVSAFDWISPPARARWLAPLSHSWLAYAVSDEFLAIRSGFFNRRIAVIPHRRIQLLGVSDGPLTRRAGVAAVSVFLAGAQHVIENVVASRAKNLVFSATARLRGTPPSC